MARATQEQSPSQISNALLLLEQRAAIVRMTRETGISANALLSVIDKQIAENANEATAKIITEASHNTGIPAEVEDVVYNS